jgi:hypothetical protein
VHHRGCAGGRLASAMRGGESRGVCLKLPPSLVPHPGHGARSASQSPRSSIDISLSAPKSAAPAPAATAQQKKVVVAIASDSDSHSDDFVAPHAAARPPRPPARARPAAAAATTRPSRTSACATVTRRTGTTTGRTGRTGKTPGRTRRTGATPSDERRFCVCVGSSVQPWRDHLGHSGFWRSPIYTPLKKLSLRVIIGAIIHLGKEVCSLWGRAAAQHRL